MQDGSRLQVAEPILRRRPGTADTDIWPE